ncbi:MAG: protein kinase domain-containing protein [Gemmatimonadales bacterium]
MTTFLHCPHCGGRMEPTDRSCPFCGGRRSVAVTGGSLALPPPVADASDLALATELQMTLHPGIIVLRELGRGGMGLVFLAREPALRRLVVIKVLAPELAQDATARTRFRREAEAAAAVAHPNVVAVHQAGELPRSGTAYLVMQFINGPTLAEEFPAGTVAPEARARRVMAEVAAALAAAHARGLIHRDIKPANVMLERETGRAIVLDFGVSAARHSATHHPGPRITQEGVTLGTPVYMSPEQAASEPVTDRSDVYSLGIVMFELVTGRAPFEENTPVALAAAHLHKAPPPVESLRPDLDSEFAGLIDRCLAKQPERRPDAAAISRALMPASTAGLEWPPPGLARLHGAGRRTLHRFRLATAAACAYIVVLAWLGTAVSGPGWLMLSAGVVVVALGLNLGAERTNGRMLRWLGAGRQAGYPFRVLMDVALDHPQDNGALIGGSGMFALTTPENRLLWLTRRRIAGAVRAIGMALAGVAVVLWVVGWLDVGSGSLFRALSIGDAIVLFSPWLIAEGIAVGVTWGELRIRLATGRRPENFIARFRTPVIRRDLVEGWLTNTGATILPPRSRWGARFERFGWSIWTLPAVALALALISLTWTTAWNQHIATRSALIPWNTWVNSTLERGRAPTPWKAVSALVDTLLQGWGDTAADTVTARQMLNFTSFGHGPGTPFSVAYDHQADTVLLAKAWTVIPSRLSPSLMARMAQDTAVEGMVAFRRVARSPLSPTWYGSSWASSPDLPFLNISNRPFRSIWDYAIRDAASGALALNHHDTSEADERMREILGTARSLLRAPTPAVRDLGLHLAELGGQLLSAIGRSAMNPTVVERGSRLQANAVAALAPEAHVPWPSAAAAAADLSDVPWEHLAGDRDLAPPDRWLLMNAVEDGACWNQREVMAGPSRARFRLLRAMADSVRDLASADTFSARVLLRLTFLNSPLEESLDPQYADPPWLLEKAAQVSGLPPSCDDDRRRKLTHYP